MFRKITVAYNGSPEAARALAQSIHLAKALGAELCAITVQQNLAPYTAYAAAVDSSLLRALIEDQRAHCARLHSEARDTALREGVKLETHLLEGNAVVAIVRFLLDNKTDLLVIGLHRHGFAHIASMEHGLRSRARRAMQCSWSALTLSTTKNN